MRRQPTRISLIVIFVLLFVVLASSVRVSSPADADSPVLSTYPNSSQPTSEPTLETSEPTVEPTVPTETTAPTDPPKPPPAIASPYAFIYDTRTDAFIHHSSDLHEMLYPASITKLFTAYVALQHLKPTDVATVGNILDTLPGDSSIALLNPGDKLSVSDLIRGMLLPSGGDAARVLAVAVGKQLLGSADQPELTYYNAFIEEMNRQAQLLGMNDSHFENPDGYHADGHYISLADAARMGEVCLSSSLIMEAASTTVYTAIVRNTGRDILWTNTNKLLFKERYPEFYHEQAVGLKTGYTSKAGNCLMSAFKVNGGYLIIGVFGGEGRDDRFYDTLKLFQYATT